MASLTLDVYDMLFGVAQLQRPVMDTLSTQVTDAADVTWRFTSYAMWKQNDYAEYWLDDGTAREVVRMTTDAPSGAADVTVVRSQRGTTAAAAAIAAGTTFLKNPPVTCTEIQRAITETIDNDLYANPYRVFYRSQRTITPVTNKHRYELNAEDYQVDDMYQIDLTGTSLGAAVYTETGGVTEDMWTLAAHGLVAGDHVRFTAVGTGATGYAVDTDYWVAAVTNANVFTLSATNGGTAIEGTGNSAGTWTLQKQTPSLHKFNVHTWKERIDVATAESSTGNSLQVDAWIDGDHPVYYTARTRPLTANVASFTADIADLIPWGAMARLMGMVSVRDRSDPRRRSEHDAAQQPFADSEFFRARFLEGKRSLHHRLIGEKAPQKRFILPHLAGRV
ncbi:MAG: hypothetical protein ABIJ75_10190 [Actinomycetota bacterium]